MIGYHLSSEEHGPTALVEAARRAESEGFGYAQISDHFHPWVPQQGESAFVWGVLGAIAHATTSMQVGTAVTCPTMRIHPAIVAQAAATAAVQFEGRFFLGVGSGERLNEHVLGGRWPAPFERLSMLEEAIAVIRALWEGGQVDHRGRHYAVHQARIHTLPDRPPPMIVSAFGDDAAQLAARAGDGLMTTSPDRDVVAEFGDAGGSGDKWSMLHVCVASSRGEALETTRAWWPNVAIPGPAGLELARPEDFEPLAQLVTDEGLAADVVLGADPDEHVAALRAYTDAGYDHVAVHQIGPDQNAFFDFYGESVLPKL